MATQNAGTIRYGNKELTYTLGKELDAQLAAGIITNHSNAQVIIGHTATRDSIILFSTDDAGMDCVWRLNNVLRAEYELELLYVRNLGFSTSSPIQAIFNYENENIQKVYWVDGEHQIRFINLEHSGIEGNEALIDVASTSIDVVGVVDFSQPVVSQLLTGGTHTAGKIQYAYNLFRLNSSQTKSSPLSPLTSLDKGANLGGGELNEIVGATPVVNILDIDTSYDYIRVYAIKYTSFNKIPSISLIEEREIDSDGNLTFFDDGTVISTLTLEEFLFLGSNPVTPKHIETKDNRLFMANIQTNEFLLPEELDMRAYSFGINSTASNVYNAVELDPTTDTPTGKKLPINASYIVPTKHDSINLDYDTIKYQYNSSIKGATGKYLKLEIVQQNLGNNVKDYQVLKDRELYRFGIEFYNRLGQKSLPLWICDYKMPTGNLQANHNTLKVTLLPAFTTWLTTYEFASPDDAPVGYRILRANRNIGDRTIICQGVLSGMMVNSPRDAEKDALYTTVQKKADSQIQPKVPNFLIRTFEDGIPLVKNNHLFRMQEPKEDSRIPRNHITEVQHDTSERKADTYQYTSMYQLYSPEIIFDTVSLNVATKFNVIGGVENTYNGQWTQRRTIASKAVETEIKTLGNISPHVSGADVRVLSGAKEDVLRNGLIGESNENDPDVFVEFTQWYREFTTFHPSTLQEYNIYGAPELTQRGQGRTTYNNNSKYVYKNTLEGFLSDGEDAYNDDGLLDRTIVSLNSYGADCITFVSDRGDNEDVDPHTRYSLEDLYNRAAIGNTNTALISEMIRPTNDIYFGGIYSGTSYEDKQRTSYVSIGNYSDITTNVVNILSAGDTYVQEFRFTRLAKTDVEVYSTGVNQITELVSVVLETTVDLKNRNDISISAWDGRFQPGYGEYHTYNRVYSQQPILVQTTGLESTFRRVENFDTRIQATKLKVPNESVDSWTDTLENEIMDLDGKFGPINNLISYNDNVFAFQDTGIAQIIINPRIQIQGDDNVGIELGTGSILYDNKYLTTSGGSINKWGMTSTNRGIYYYDALNKGVGRIPDAVQISLTDKKGWHSYFNNNYNYDLIKEDNPVLGKGVVFGSDLYNNDVYFTLLQDDKSFTRCFNELKDEFIDLKTYKPSRYINKGERLISVPSTATNTLFEHNKGMYNHFYGDYYPSYIILQINPESDTSCVFDSIFYNSELYLNDIDQPDKTLTSIRAYNEYQDSGVIPLVVGRNKNLRRKFREWKAEIPRDGRNRIRNPWIKLKLQLDNTDNYKLILHDIIITYTV